MEIRIVERENNLYIPVEEDAVRLSIELGWDPKEGSLADKLKDAFEVAVTGVSKNVHDLDLAAIIEYSDENADLIFHGQGFQFDRAESVLLGSDSRTGISKGVNEHMTVNLKNLSANVKRVLFMAHLQGGKTHRKYLSDVANPFLQIQSDERAIFTDVQSFGNPEAEDATSLVFAALVRNGEGWAIQGISRYSVANNVHDIYEGITGEEFR